MSSYDYDLFVIGAGSGGVRAARMASGYGARVAVAEEDRAGGTCVIRGCVPKKLFVYAGHYALDFEEAAGFGWATNKTRFDWKALVSAKDAEIDRLNRLYIQTLAKAGAELIQERAVVSGPHAVRLLQSGKEIRARYILVATGSAPFIDTSIPGHEHVITSNDAFHLNALPRSIIIAGASYIAIEFANIFHHLGVKTTVLYRRDRILRGFDDDLRDSLMAAMRESGIDIVTENIFTRIEKDHSLLRGHLTDGKVLEAETIMLAIGRRPKTDGLGLETAGIELAANGAVPVDAWSKTSCDSIYAVGDVTDRMNLTPVAIREGAAVGETLFNNNPQAMDHDLIPTAVFSTPEIGTVGLTEAKAVEKHQDIDIYVSRFRPLKHALSGSTASVTMKLVVEASTNRVVGMHILSDGAAEMIQAFAVAIKMGATKADLDATVAVHPTSAEELVTMKTPTRRYRDGTLSD